MTFLGLGLLELLFVSLLLVALVLGTSLDRSYKSYSIKWWVAVAAIGVFGVFNFNTFTVNGLIGSLFSMDFWRPAAVYLGAGLLYSAFEFVITIRRLARETKEAWTRLLDEDVRTSDGISGAKIAYVKLSTVIQNANAEGGDLSIALAHKHIDSFITSRMFKYDGLLNLKRVGTEIDTTVDKAVLSRHIGAWTIFWPAYFVSMIIGDLLVEIFNAVAEFFVKLGGRFVRATFADVFKV